MAEVDDINEDQWLYGEGGEAGPGMPATETNGDAPMDEEPAKEEPDAENEPVEDPPQLLDPEKESELKPPGEDDFPPAPGTEEPAPPGEGSPKEGEEEGEDDDDDDDSDDDIRVTIGDIKTAPPQYSGLSKMRGAVLSSGLDKHIKVGKFSIDEFESIGSINGYPAHEFSIDAMEEKPWRKPGADITDYFNYGFNEDTWRAYCERQKTLRVHESGVGLGGLGMPRNSSLVNVITDNNKYIGGGTGGPPMGGASPMVQPATAGVRKPAPPVGTIAGARRTTGVIDVIGAGVASRRTTDSPPPQENVIQVMSSDRRDYGKSFDLSVPPPGFDAPPPGLAPPPVIPGYPSHGGYPGEYYGPDSNMEYYSSSYEPTQDMQRWGGSEVRSSRQRDRRSRGHSMSPPHKRTDRHAHSSSVSKDELPGGITIKQEPIDKGYKDSRERERERSERHKERSHRHRSRSRSADRDRRSSRKHKSRSRSPGHRSHKKKKSKKSDKRENSSGD